MKRLKRLKPPSWSQLLALEQNPNVPIAQKALAALHLDFAMGPDREFWTALKKLRHLDLAGVPDIHAYLALFAQKSHHRKNLALVGDLAVHANVLSHMPLEFQQTYVSQLKDCVQGIKLAQALNLGEAALVPLNTRMGHLDRAERCATTDESRMLLIQEYARLGDTQAVYRLIDTLQNPDQHTLVSVLRCYNLPIRLVSISEDSRPQLDAAQKRLVTAINALLADHPTILNDEIYHLWSMLLLGNVEVVQRLLTRINEATALDQGALTGVLEHAPKPLLLWLVQEMNEQRFPAMTEKDWCAVLSRLTKQDNFMMMVEQIRFANLLTPKVVSALCRFDVPGLVTMVLDSPTKTQNMILAAWKQEPSPEQAKELVPFSLEPDFRVLRAILCTYASHSNWPAVAWWLREYSSRQIVLPPALLDSLPAILSCRKIRPVKLPKPERGTPQDWQLVLDEALPKSVSRDIVPAI